MGESILDIGSSQITCFLELFGSGKLKGREKKKKKKESFESIKVYFEIIFTKHNRTITGMSKMQEG